MVSYVGGADATNAVPPTLPAHNKGDLIIGFVVGKPFNAGNIDLTGFTRVGRISGGTGTMGGDVGPTYIQLFAKIGNGVTTAPGLSGGAGGNCATCGFVVLRPDPGYHWRDLFWLPPYVAADDSSDAGDLSATSVSAYVSGEEPNGANGDAIVSIGGLPTDAHSGVASLTHSATGLSGGTSTNRLYNKTANGNDCGHVAGTWLGFSGVPSSGITTTFVMGGAGNTGGPIANIAVRQELNDHVHLAIPLNAATTGVITVTGAITLPIHQAGDRMLCYVSGRPDTTALPTINQGWTMVASGVGGTGTFGADTGASYWALFAKDATSSSETPPTLTFGSPATDVSIWDVAVFRPATGRSWADPIVANAPWVVATQDVTAGSVVLTGTPAAFPYPPTTGDALIGFGTTPTDATTSVQPTSSLTVPGISGGEDELAATATVTGNDMSDYRLSKVDFQGTATGAPTLTFNMLAGFNTTGPIVVAALRQAYSSGWGMLLKQ